jgi:RES domain-containing protein
MKYDAGLYNFDRENSYHEASLEKGAFLYRLTSVNHAGLQDILSGKGPELSRAEGRFNAPQQKATYCTNNALVCIAEVLYHMYRVVLDLISNGMPYRQVQSSLHAERCLVVVRVKEIKDLVYCDCEGARRDFNAKFGGTTVVFPDNHYEPFWDFNNTIRKKGKKGVIYPSARHSRDLCLVLFDDETPRIMRRSVYRLNIKLQLLPEDQDPRQPPRKCDPLREKLHATMGYYSFENQEQYDKARNAHILNPGDTPFQGMIDFVRRKYNRYPGDAVLR